MTSPTPTPTTGTTPAPNPADTTLPTATVTCRPATDPEALPRSFLAACSGCHNPYTSAGTAGIPSLFAFKGTAADFVAQVRKGGKTMAAFDEAAIATKDLEAASRYFRAGKPGAALICAGASGTIVAPVDACSGAGIELTPLYAEAAPDTRKVVTTDGRGWVITRGAGRVRGRHELEGDFGPFHPLYFENRSYEFLIEDSTPAGGTTVKFTYLPNGEAADNPRTNFRAWKVYDNGNVFYANLSMQKITSKRWEYTVTSNSRDRRPMRKGDVLEFEFGIFFNPSAVPGRTAYYTDTFRYRVGEGGLTAANSDPALGMMGPGPAGMLAGAATIPYVIAEPELSFSQMALSIQPENVQRFLEGRRLFHTNFTTGAHSESGNPIFMQQVRKAGPLFNRASCTACHLHNGRGQPPAAGAALATMVVKTFGNTVYGRQLNDRTTDGMTGDGEATIDFTEVRAQFKEGTTYTLLKPAVSFRRLAGAPPAQHSVRVARQVVGMGLLEAVPESTVLALADAGDCNKDGISGRANLVADPDGGKVRLGRFGWKAGKVSVKHQVADALLVDVGVTTRLFPEPECGANTTCNRGTGPELSDDELDKLTTYMRGLGLPPRRRMEDPRVQRGEQLFGQVGCASCHSPVMVTGAGHPFVELRNQVIRPYTDLLLHDMGPDLADVGDKEGQATASEWRTPPLWGIGLVKTVSGHTRFLHDGRARNLLEAVLWHGGEAQAAKDRVLALPAADREALVAFLESL